MRSTTSGAAKAFGSALDAAGPEDGVGRLQRKIAAAWLMQHGADAAEPHLCPQHVDEFGPTELALAATAEGGAASAEPTHAHAL